VKCRETVEIDHPAGEEIQWDWFECRGAPWGSTAFVLAFETFENYSPGAFFDAETLRDLAGSEPTT